MRPWFLLSAAAALSDDWESVSFPRTSPALNTTQWTGRFRTTGRLYNASLATFDPSTFQIALPPQGCVKHGATSTTASYAGCLYATNAGFFDFPPKAACEGNLIVNTSIIQFESSVRTNIAVNSTHVLVGYASNDTVGLVNAVSLVSGLGWLVRNGLSYVDSSREFPAPPPTFVTEWAPRTGAGVTGDGLGLLLTVDGIEGTSQAAGASLYEFADLFVQVGARHAMNLDGGGSTTAVKCDASRSCSVYNKPHCDDTWAVCERAVTSITCVTGQQ